MRVCVGCRQSRPRLAGRTGPFDRSFFVASSPQHGVAESVSVAFLPRVGSGSCAKGWYPAGNDPHGGDLILESEERPVMEGDQEAWNVVQGPSALRTAPK